MRITIARILGLFLLALSGFAVAALAESDAVFQPTQRDALKPGEFVWMPELAPSGPVAIVVSLPAQRAYVYRNGVRIGMSTVSTGKPGSETPSGIYTILHKRREHHSNLYESEPMPFMQRLTWDGVALHAGDTPGYPDSHGCVRFPPKFAELLFAATAPGTVVVIAAADTFPQALVSPGLLSPIDAATGSAPTARPSHGTRSEWFPQRSPNGPLTILLSTSDQRMVVLRNAVEIGWTEFAVTGEPIVGTQAYVLLEGNLPEPSAVVPDRPALRWLSLPVTGSSKPGADLREAIRTAQLAIPQSFARLVYDELRPGATVIVTDEPLQPGITNARH